MSEGLLRALREAEPRRRRFDLERLWEAFASTHPADAEGPGARRELRARLDALARSGAIALPASLARWDRSVEPALPNFVRVRETNAQATVAPTVVAWAPELRFAREIRSRAQLDVLSSIQRFLSEGGRARPPVPERERSLELFGDEKKLEKLRRTRLFGPGRLSLELLRCFSVSPPLVWEAVDTDSHTAIILENHHTYHSFRAHAGRTRNYAAVVYGAGKALCRSAESLVAVARATGIERFEYFGDLDAEGVHIARLSSDRARAAGVGPLLPSRYYAELVRFPPRPGPREGCADEDLQWLPATLQPAVAEATATGLRWPQEYIGSDYLSA